MAKLVVVCLLIVATVGIACSNGTSTQTKRAPTAADTRSSTQNDYERCGFIDGEQVNCKGEAEICAVVEWRSQDGPRCYPTDICNRDQACSNNDCLVMESWPAQIRCAQ